MWSSLKSFVFIKYYRMKFICIHNHVVSLKSFVFIKYYRMKFICIHNHVVIFKVSCKLYDNKYMITSIQITDIEIFAIMDVLVVLVFHGSY